MQMQMNRDDADDATGSRRSDERVTIEFYLASLASSRFNSSDRFMPAEYRSPFTDNLS